MPYLAHFGLKEHPFTLTPNTNQYYPIEKHIEIIQSIQFGIARNTGILKVVGDVGTGKTMLCRLLLRKTGRIGRCGRLFECAASRSGKPGNAGLR